MDNLLRQARAIKEQGTVFAGALGTPVRFKQIPVQAFSDQLTGYGISPALVQGLLEMMIAKDNGLAYGIARTPQNAIETPATSGNGARTSSSRPCKPHEAVMTRATRYQVAVNSGRAARAALTRSGG